MLTSNPKIRKEMNRLADSAESTVRQIRHAVRDTRGAARDAVAPVAGEVGALIAQLEQTMEVLGREGSSEAMQAGRRLQDRARARVDHAVDGVQHRVAASPLKALAIAAAAGALVAWLLAANGRGTDD